MRASRPACSTPRQQIGGAIGLAAASTIAITFTGHYVDSHPGVAALSAPALTYGFQITFYVLAGVAALPQCCRRC